MQNWPFNFQFCHFSPLTFNFSLLTFNFYQFSTPLYPNYILLLIEPKWRCFVLFYLFIFYNKFRNLKNIYIFIFFVNRANLDAVFLGRRWRLKCLENEKYQLSCFFLNGISFLLNPNLLKPIFWYIWWMFVKIFGWLMMGLSKHVGLSDKFVGFSLLCGFI